MKQILIPTDINEIADLSKFKESILEVNKFSKNLHEFAKKIVYDKFVKSNEDWMKILTKEDYANNQQILVKGEDFWSDDRFLFNYETKKISEYYTARYSTMGQIAVDDTIYTFSDDAKNIIITQNYRTKHCRMEHIPWINHVNTITIDYISGSVSIKNSQK